jgi:Na+-translocating ferredoxin:NAD+ oxidoreductase RNF subunit RnfB
MSMMSNAIVMALAPVFFVLLLGYAAGKFHIVDNHQVDGLNALVMVSRYRRHCSPRPRRRHEVK